MNEDEDPGDPEGRYFDGVTSQGVWVRLTQVRGQLYLTGDALNLQWALSDVQLLPRLGKTQRQLRLPDGAVCELNNHPLLDRWFHKSSRHNLLALLEGHLGVILATSLILAGSALGIGVWGLPWAARELAPRLPPSLAQELGRRAEQALDEAMGARSGLPEARQAQLRAEFAALAQRAGVSARFKFRAWPTMGANALALPNGTVIVTDAMVGLADDDRELQAVVAHELGHVQGRHALRLLIASSGVATWVLLLTGDSSSWASLAAGAPLLLGQMKYSRDMEAEADRYALGRMKADGIDPRWFVRILSLLQRAGGNSVLRSEWMLDHPLISQRIHDAEQYQGLGPARSARAP